MSSTDAIPAAIYLRISRDHEGAGLGVERQEADCRALAERLGWDVVATFVDNDISAYSGKPRPQYRAMLDAVRAGRVRGVVAWHTDRLHRRATELEEFVALAEDHGLMVQTVTAGTLDLATPSGRMVARMLGAAAQHEVEQTKRRIRAQKAQAAADGRYRGGRRPFGYEADGLTVRDDEAALVVEATRSVLAGRSVASVARELNERGSRTARGREWEVETLRAVLMRPRNAGLVHTGDARKADVRIVGHAQWPALVDEETWRALHSMMTEPSRRSNKVGSEPRWLGSGIYTCGVVLSAPAPTIGRAGTTRRAGMGREAGEVCGAVMRVHTVTSTPSRERKEPVNHYRCSSGAHLTLKVQPTDKYVREVVAEMVRDPRLVAALTGEEGAPLAADRERRVLLIRRIEQTDADYDADLIDARRHKAKVEKLTAELAEIQARLDEGVQAATVLPIFKAVDPGAAFLQAPLDVQRAVLRAVLRVEVLPRVGLGKQAWTPLRLRLAPVVASSVDTAEPVPA